VYAVVDDVDTVRSTLDVTFPIVSIVQVVQMGISAPAVDVVRVRSTRDNLV